MVAFDDINRLSLPKECQERRRRRNTGEVLPGTLGGFEVLSGKHRYVPVRLNVCLSGHGDRRPSVPGRTATDGVDDEKHGLVLRLVKGRIHLIGRSQLLDAEARELFTHRLNHLLWIGHIDNTFLLKGQRTPVRHGKVPNAPSDRVILWGRPSAQSFR